MPTSRSTGGIVITWLLLGLMTLSEIIGGGNIVSELVVTVDEEAQSTNWFRFLIIAGLLFAIAPAVLLTRRAHRTESQRKKSHCVESGDWKHIAKETSEVLAIGITMGINSAVGTWRTCNAVANMLGYSYASLWVKVPLSAGMCLANTRMKYIIHDEHMDHGRESHNGSLLASLKYLLIGQIAEDPSLLGKFRKIWFNFSIVTSHLLLPYFASNMLLRTISCTNPIAIAVWSVIGGIVIVGTEIHSELQAMAHVNANGVSGYTFAAMLDAMFHAFGPASLIIIASGVGPTSFYTRAALLAGSAAVNLWPTTRGAENMFRYEVEEDDDDEAEHANPLMIEL